MWVGFVFYDLVTERINFYWSNNTIRNQWVRKIHTNTLHCIALHSDRLMSHDSQKSRDVPREKNVFNNNAQQF